MDEVDPFRHHPRLRGLIGPPEGSRLRDIDMAEIDEYLASLGHRDFPDRYPDEVRDAMRDAHLGARMGRDMWVFAYGSLMWDPAFRFVEVRRARLEGHVRRFCLHDTTARGSIERPGLMAALVPGERGCDGLAFRIAAEALPVEADVIWRREMLFPGYLAEFREVDTAHGKVEALCFLADLDDPFIRPDLPHDEVARRVATGEGFLGTNMFYVESIVAHFREMGIDDPEMERLLADARAVAGA